MTDSFIYDVRLRDGDSNMFGVLRTSRLFEIMQEAAGLHSIQLGIDQSVTLQKGYVWMITTQRADILRIPQKGEHITVETWTGKQRFGIYPRYYSLWDDNGDTIVNCASNWVLVHEQSRTLGTPEETGVIYDWHESKQMIKPATAPRRLPTDYICDFTVPFSYCDINQHMNNTRYFDLAEDIIPATVLEKIPYSVSSEYRKEIKPGETVHLSFGYENSSFFVSGETTEPAFRIRYEYKD